MKSFLQSAHQLLEDNGLFISLQPTGSFALWLAWISRFGRVKQPLPLLFWIFDAPWHIALYSIKGMKRLGEENGYELIEIRSAPQGRVKGFYGVIQMFANWMNQIGWTFFKTSWPLMVSHTFVFRKKL